MSHPVPVKPAQAPGQKKKELLKLLVAAGMIAGAAVLLFRFVREQRPSEELAYYYDLSERKLFTAPRTLVPPVRGLNDLTEDAPRCRHLDEWKSQGQSQPPDSLPGEILP